MNNKDTGNDKARVREFWDRASCGEELYLKGDEKSSYEQVLLRRYELEPYIKDFADFPGARGKKVLEIGIGLGSDHHQFAAAGAKLTGIDLTERAVLHTKRNLKLFGFSSNLMVGDAEKLDFSDESFDLVYSWGVLHHSPDTPKAIDEVCRVLRKDGLARIMIYHKWSMIGLMLWIRYGLLRFKPFSSLKDIYSKYLESPGTKAYTISEARQLFSKFSSVDISIELTHGDLLSSKAGQRHEGKVLALARLIWPRWFIKKFFPKAGLFMLIEARK